MTLDATSTLWQGVILDALEELDQKEAPHGLYGIRQAHSAGGRLPMLAQLLASGTKEFLGSNGCRPVKSPVAARELRFKTKVGECVALQVLDYATTKIRDYGSAYRLDEHHTKRVKEPALELETLVPKLATKQRTGSIRGILLIAHIRQKDEIRDLLGRSVDQGFLRRYQIGHSRREWSDRYGRSFSTTIHLWTPLENVVEASAAA